MKELLNLLRRWVLHLGKLLPLYFARSTQFTHFKPHNSDNQFDWCNSNAGAVGAGGIGDLAISYGYQRFDTSVVILTVIVLLLLVQIVQTLGNWLSKIR